jgi:hypothetical protein
MNIVTISNLTRVVAVLVTAVGLVACSLWYRKKNKIDTKTKIKNNAPKDFNKSTIFAEDFENLQISSQEKGETSVQEVSGSMIKSSQASLQEKDDAKIECSGQECDVNDSNKLTPEEQEQDGVKIELSQERDTNPLENNQNNSFTGLTPENASCKEQNGAKIKDLETLPQEHDANPFENNLNKSSTGLTLEQKQDDEDWETLSQSSYQEQDSIKIINLGILSQEQASCQEHNFTEIKYSGIIPQEHGASPLENTLNNSTSEQELYQDQNGTKIEESGTLSQEQACQEQDGAKIEKSGTLSQEQVSCQEQDDVKIKDLGTSSQECDVNNSNEYSAELKSEIASQTTLHKVVQSDFVNVHEPEASEQYEEIPENRLKIDSPIMHNHMDTSKEESEVSSQSDIDNEESLYKDACVQTEPQVSRSIILNDQLPISIPLPNETASDMLNEFCTSNVVYAFTGQDLIDFEDYDEEEEIRRFLFRKVSF